jgi:hypothetical protein
VLSRVEISYLHWNIIAILCGLPGQLADFIGDSQL